MRKLRQLAFGLIALVVLVAGCASGHSTPIYRPQSTSQPTTSPTTRPAIPNTLVWSESLRFSASSWRRAVNSRFGPVALVVICHGGEVDGHWCLFPDDATHFGLVQDEVGRLHKQHTGRPIVLVVCNPGAHELHGLPGVYYVKRNVICPPYNVMPDFVLPTWLGDAGDIREFSSNE